MDFQFPDAASIIPWKAAEEGRRLRRIACREARFEQQIRK